MATAREVTPAPAPARRAVTRSILAGFLLWMQAAPALAVDQAQLDACLANADVKLRLACYDAIGRAPTAAAGTAEYPVVSLLDLKLDKDKLLGRGVMTSGRLTVLGQLVFLRTNATDNTPLPIGLTRLTAEQQREVQTRCAPACIAQIKGKVVHVSLGVGVAAEAVTVSAQTP